jgi:hypothetical protein
MFVPAFSPKPQLRQPDPQDFTLPAVAVRHPQPKAPVLGVAATATGLKITFPSEAGRTYTVQSQNALDQATWSPVQSPIAGTGSDLTVEVPFGVATGFVRVSVE